MLTRINVALLSIMMFSAFCPTIFAQNITGKKIYISSGAEVRLKFASDIVRSSFNPAGANNSFTYETGKRYIIIRARIENFDSTTLIVDEGKGSNANTHTFILLYKKEIDISELIYDYSSKEKIEAAVKALEESKKADVVTNNAATNDPTDKSQNNNGQSPSKDKPETAAPVATNTEDKANKFLQVKTNANRAFNDGNYDEALGLYKQGLELKPGDPWCEAQIEEIANLKNAAKARENAINAQKLNEASYNTHRNNADDAKKKKEYEAAKKEYNEALKYKPGDPYANAQLNEIDNIQRDNAYNDYMDIGKQYLENHLFDKAQAAFKGALEIKQNDPEAKRLLISIDKEKEEYNKEEKEKAKNAAKEKTYRDTLTFADNAFEAGLLDKAKAIYKWALTIKSSDPYPKDQIAKIDSINQRRMAESTQKKLDSLKQIKYAETKAKAEKEFAAKQYKQAIATWQNAAEIMPASNEPAAMISDIEVLLNREEEEQKKVNEKRRREDSINTAFDFEMKQFAINLKNGEYEKAGEHISNALGLKPEDIDAQNKSMEINRLLAEKEKEAKYQYYLNTGDSIMYKSGNPDEALKWYQLVMELKPDDNVARKKYIYANNQIRIRDSLENERQLSATLTKNFDDGLGYYKQADDARKEKKFSDAYSGYNDFLLKIDTLKLNKYSETQLYYINHAMGYRNALAQFNRKTVSIEDVKKKYPDIDFSMAPPGQKLDRSGFSDSKENTDFLNKINSLAPRTILILNEGRLKLILEGIYFTDQNVYFKYVLQNNDTSEFLTGPMSLSLRNNKSSLQAITAAYISDFPVILPGEQKGWILVIRNLVLGAGETLFFQVADRSAKVKLDLSIPAAIYHTERIR